MNSCVLKARKGTVMVSPFISTQEKQVMQVLLRERLPLSPWPYDGGKRHISRADCMALNAMAEDICTSWAAPHPEEICLLHRE